MASAQSEPSMDEILASIRRIISEEDESPADARPKLEPLELSDDVAVEVDADASEKEVLTAEAAPAEVEELVAKGASEELPEETATSTTVAPEVEAEAAQAAEQEKLAEDPLDDFAENTVAEATKNEAEMSAQPSSSPISDDNLLSDGLAAKVAQSFGTLHENVRVSQSSGRTIEDLVEAMLRPMLQQWIDDHLPRIVEDKVEEEVRRIARRR